MALRLSKVINNNKKFFKMSEETIKENEIYVYVNDKGQKVVTPNLEFAHLMAFKYGTEKVYVEKF